MASIVLQDGQWVVVLTPKEQARVSAATLTAPAEKKWDKDGGIRCHVDPKCTWTGKSLARSRVHATADTLQAAGHMPKAAK